MMFAKIIDHGFHGQARIDGVYRPVFLRVIRVIRGHSVLFVLTAALLRWAFATLP